MIFKGTVFLEFSGQGWTENWYVDAADRPAALSTMKSYVTQRRKSLNTLARIKRVRVCNPDPPRDADIFSYLGGLGDGTFPDAAGNPGPEAINAAVNVRFIGANGSWRNELVRGLPQGAIVYLGEDSQVGETWAAAYQQTIDFVKAGTLRFRRATVPVAGSFITAVRTLNSIIQSFTTAAPIPGGPVAGDVIKVQDVVGISNANGLWQVSVVGAGNEYFVRRHKKVSVGTLDAQTGRASKVVYVYDQMPTGVFIGPTSKKTGRPSTRPRGRASVRRS